MSLDGVNILFVHIPKTGGTSIEKGFRDAGFKMSYYDPTGANKSGSLNMLRKCSPQHMHADLILNNFNISKFDLVFTVVRDPIARAKSEYAMRNHPKFSLESDVFEQWIAETLISYNNNKFIYDNHIRPQTEFIIPGTKIFKLEDGLESISEYIAQTVGINIDFSKKKMHRLELTGLSPKDVEINQRAEVMLRTFYREDFHLFNYR